MTRMRLPSSGWAHDARRTPRSSRLGPLAVGASPALLVLLAACGAAPASSGTDVSGGDPTIQAAARESTSGSPSSQSAGSWSAYPSGTTQPLYGVRGSGPSDVWAVGYQTIVHWNGSAWQVAYSDALSTFYAVHASSPTDAWAVGDHYASGAYHPLLMHWDGATWSTVAVAAGSPNPRAVWGSGPSDVWAIGIVIGNVADAAGTMHWDGSAWTNVPNPGTSDSELFAVWGSGPDDVWATGNATMHWDGTAWTLEGPTTGASGIWGTSSSEVWIAGYRMHHWNGSHWSGKSRPALDGNAVWDTGAGNAWTVGNGGTILHWVKDAWSASSSGTTVALNGIWGTVGGALWAVGDSGTILKH